MCLPSKLITHSTKREDRVRQGGGQRRTNQGNGTFILTYLLTYLLIQVFMSQLVAILAADLCDSSQDFVLEFRVEYILFKILTQSWT